MSKLTIRSRQWLARYETDPEVKRLIIEGLAKCETDPEVKQLLSQMLTECKAERQGIKQLLTQALAESETDLEVKQSLTQVQKSCLEALKYLRKTPQSIYAETETYKIHRMRQFVKDMEKLDIRKDYVELLRGMDCESIYTVNTILARTKALCATHQAELDIFSDEEQLQIRILEKEFWKKIFQLDECCFAYMDYLLPVNSFEPSVLFYHHEMRHLTAPERIGEKAIMDVGGFIGDSALVFAKKFRGQIHSFEPTSINYQRMLQTIAMNKLSGRITPVNVGLAETMRQASIYIEGSGSSEYPVRAIKGEPEIAEMITLDSYVAENNLEVGLIKIDVEGAEQNMLKGAEETIRAQRPTLIVSIYHNAYDFFQIKPLLESWNLGYKFKIRRPIDGHILTETVLLAEAD